MGCDAISVKIYNKTLVSIHAPHVGCDLAAKEAAKQRAVSIHAPHVGCDHAGINLFVHELVSIHAPHVGCDSLSQKTLTIFTVFQSTHPTWGATADQGQTESKVEFQSTHPTWGATAFVLYLYNHIVTFFFCERTQMYLNNIIRYELMHLNPN